MLRSNNYTFHSEYSIIFSVIGFDKCERCRQSPATIDCQECGTSSRALKLCYDCDKTYHKMFDKESHQRRPIKFDSTLGKALIILQYIVTSQQLTQETKCKEILEIIKYVAPFRQNSPLRRKFEDTTSKSPLRSERFNTFGEKEQLTTMRSTYGGQATLQGSTIEYIAPTPQFYEPQIINKNPSYRTLNLNVIPKGDTLLSPSSTISQTIQHEEQLLLSQRLRETMLNKSGYKSRQADRENFSPQRSFGMSSTKNLHQSTYEQQSYYQPVQHQLSTIQLQQVNQEPSLMVRQDGDLNTYYQKMAEDYRQKYLVLEKDHHFMKNNHEYEIQKLRQQLNDNELKINERITYEIADIERNHREQLQQKDYQINILQKQLMEMELRISQESQEVVSMQRLQHNIEVDYKNNLREYEKQMKDKDDRIDRLLKDQEVLLTKVSRQYEQEKDSLKRDYEQLLQQVREEYQKCNSELRLIIESKNSEILNLNQSVQSEQERLRKERQDFEETLSKDKFTKTITQTENEKLRESRKDWESEKEQMLHDLKNLEDESERCFIENKELKRKVKKLEHILYGRKGGVN